MHRPLYALIVLLEAIAGSLLLVKSAHSQVQSLRVGHGTGCVYIFAWPVDESGTEEFYGECAGLGCTLKQSKQWDVSPTANEVESPRCADIRWIDSEYNVGNEAGTLGSRPIGDEGSKESLPVFTFSGPATSLRFENLDGCGGGGIAGGGALLVDGCEAEGWVDAPASDARLASAAHEAQKTCQALHSAVTHAAETARLLWTSSWAASLPRYPANSSLPADHEVELTADEASEVGQALGTAAIRTYHWATIAWNGLWAPYREHDFVTASATLLEDIDVIQLVRTEIPDRIAQYREEAVLIQAANTLDQMGQQLQLVARHLRARAAERIGIKGPAGHVALRNK